MRATLSAARRTPLTHAGRVLVACAPTTAPGILARGPWSPDQVEARWSDDHFEPSAGRDGRRGRRRRRARRARLAEPRRPRRAAWSATRVAQDGRLTIELQPARWSLRLVEGDASGSVAALCAVARLRGPLAGRAPRRLAGLVARALGAGRRRRRRRRREPGRHARARAARGVGGRAGARAGRGARAAAARARDVHRPGLAARGRAGRDGPRARRLRLVAGRRRRTGRPRPTSRCAGWRPCWVRPGREHRADRDARRAGRRACRSRRSSASRSPTRRSTSACWPSG